MPTLPFNLPLFQKTKDIPDIWLGGTDQHQKGDWRWVVNGQPFTFVNWYEGLPHLNGMENCSEIHSFLGFKWNDAFCFANTSSYACESSA